MIRFVPTSASAVRSAVCLAKLVELIYPKQVCFCDAYFNSSVFNGTVCLVIVCGHGRHSILAGTFSDVNLQVVRCYRLLTPTLVFPETRHV